jgi:DNA-binding FrmR family transcriptional regulator
MPFDCSGPKFGHKGKMTEKFSKEIVRMRRIEGQVRGVAKMMEEDRYCIDILQQFAAVEAALRSTKMKILEIHTNHCVDEALTSGNVGEQKKKIAELVSLFGKMGK